LDSTYRDGDFAGGFVPGEPETGGGFLPEDNSDGAGFVHNDENASGGFVPDDGNAGGGFLPEASTGFGSALLSEQQLRRRNSDNLEDEDLFGMEEQDEAQASTSKPSPTASSHSISRTRDTMQLDGTADDVGGGFIPEDEPMEDAVDDTASQSRAHKQSDIDHTQHVGQIELQVTAEVAQKQGTAHNDTTSQVAAQNAKSAPSARVESVPPASSPSDVGSLPLEDPEDEDAEPDWLLDAT
jgi:xeroderma pigmentosum group C-complementing protein